MSTYYFLQEVVADGGKICWARETTPGPRQGIHHELTREQAVTVALVPDGPPVVVRIRRGPISAHSSEIMAGLRRICHQAMQNRRKVLASYIN